MTTAASIQCPICAFEQAGGSETCARCGVVIAKARVLGRHLPGIPAVDVAPRDAGAWKILVGGLIAALVVPMAAILPYGFRQPVRDAWRALLLVERS